ncbi:MAG: O-phospho-L-seryl-tRNA:Cys-tRNA synthase [Methanoculleus sp.]|jgi:Sep-tRNA:Cys-tRNA synthetase|uniref:O-phospho-L-seryl-tRNA:Cys-tRNA synthase n=1 Tax=Methanoculleus sp. TaxID=90427 RepID=UPI002606927A|nr:O-phospho-L-seryl-tRNA:Cys-tRNA synthase [Methanoculleus sp.]MCK9305923.1 O-phospho-L-seryl-tRNA:Cys-tRNA synthase [Methanoculleus sp.]MDD2254320.1 O-phospho-L-seryl-tRNA:Cys-tRNA synthase [Methanoculleus sp.]MDD4314768.1 O-phospho-L-seryl-tRNA:Cys-tRNA synthase [Methanoculleus sp.]MDD4471144.1 O-phospho-L-seryl-tRNA:Cys-tRNA synthase [Methanoculleus sp.]
MNIRVQKTFEALFALEDLRGIFRDSLPTGLDEEEEKALRGKIADLKSIIAELEEDRGTSRTTKIADTLDIRSREEEYINIQPIQAAGRLTTEARKALISYGDGYSTCDACRKPFRLDKITKPSIAGFHDDLAKFVNMDLARVVPGARRGFQAVASTLVSKGDPVIVSALAHYTEFLAVEEAGGVVKEVPLDAGNRVTADATAEKIEAVVREGGKLPALVMIDHYDYQFANEHDVRGIAKVAHQYDIPFLYNGAYTVGVMPVDGKAIGADFVVGSGHKSMASVAPSGVLATTDEWASKVLRTTAMTGDLTKRKFGIKEVEMLGCTLMGGTLLSMMASFPTVKERTLRWDEEVKKSNYFIDALLSLEGSKVLSEYPRKHTLTKVDTTGSFDTVAQTHKRRGFYFSDELSERGIVGEFAGATRTWKLNTYGLSWKQIRYLADAFTEIAEKYELPRTK